MLIREDQEKWVNFKIQSWSLVHMHQKHWELNKLCTSLPGDDGQMRGSHTRSHEQHHIFMPCVPVRHHLSFKRFQLFFIVSFNVN